MGEYIGKIQGYAIYNPKNGLYSKGGTSPSFSKTPKIWAQLSHIKNHLNQLVWVDYRNKDIIVNSAVYEDCIIVDLKGDPVDCDIHKYLMQIAMRYKNDGYKSEYNIVERM